MTERRIPRVPDTPNSLAKYATKASTGEAERARIGCTLLLAAKLAELSETASRILDVTLKSQPAPPDRNPLDVDKIAALVQQAEAQGTVIRELKAHVDLSQRARSMLQAQVNNVRVLCDPPRSKVSREVLRALAAGEGES